MAARDTKSELTPIQSSIMMKLSDGQLHTKDSLRLLLNDEEYSSDEALKFHISILRTMLRPKGRDIVSYRSEGYRMVRLLNTEE